MMFAIQNTGKLIKLIDRLEERKRWTVLRSLMLFFLLGYAATCGLLLAQKTTFVFLVLGPVFFFGALFVLKAVQTGLHSVNSLEAVIAERTKDLEKARQDAEAAMEARTRFMANVSHEIRTPMNAVAGLTTLLLQTDLTEKQREDVLTLRQAGHVLLNVVTDVLDFAKIESGTFEIEENPFSLLELLDATQAIWHSKAQEKGISLRIERNNELWEYWLGDKIRIQQILQNLLANAIRFTDQGEVTIEASSFQTSITLKVRDTGAGIAAEDLELIFHSFRQSATDRGGTGLGLAICHRLVTAMNGELEVESELGKGSVFTVTLPLRQVKQFDNANDSLGELNQIPRKVLVADDNSVNLKVATRLLERLGCKVTTATNGLEAAEKASVDSFDLILMDCQMPVMSGLEATKKIRDEEGDHRNKIFAFTAMATSTELQACLDGGMDGYITKPVKLTKLKSALMQLEENLSSGTPQKAST